MGMTFWKAIWFVAKWWIAITAAAITADAVIILNTGAYHSWWQYHVAAFANWGRGAVTGYVLCLASQPGGWLADKP
jgi:hypothetical protein